MMLGLTLLNIVLRWCGSSLLWAEPLVRHLVFVCAFLGGALATGSGHHIRIDLISRILESRGYQTLGRVVEIVVSLFAVLVLGWLIYAGYSLVQIEFQFGKPSFLDIHSGFLVAIIPVGLALIGIRYLFLLVKHLMKFEG